MTSSKNYAGSKPQPYEMVFTTFDNVMPNRWYVRGLNVAAVKRTTV